jgi:hypothetical protein
VDGEAGKIPCRGPILLGTISCQFPEVGKVLKDLSHNSPIIGYIFSISLDYFNATIAGRITSVVQARNGKHGFLEW